MPMCSMSRFYKTGDRGDVVHSRIVSVPRLDTSRLVLLPLEEADAVQVQALFPHWEIVRYLAAVVPWPYPPDGAETFIRDIVLPGVARGDQWNWSIRLKEDPATLIGCIELKKSDIENRGFWIGRPWQGRGLITEASEAVTDYWFDVLGFPVLRVTKAMVNMPSRRVSEKNGMRVTGTIERDFVCGRLPAQRCEITADEWRQRRRHRR